MTSTPQAEVPDPMTDSSLVAEMRAIVGDAHVLVEPDMTAQYETDWTGGYTGRSTAVVRPASTEEVSAVVRVCAEHGVALVPQGGNTGLVGASVPRDGEVVLSLRRLTQLDPVDRAASQVTVGAGVTLSRVQAHAREAGLQVGIDFAARDSATIGGIVATNAGGERVLGFGMTRSQVTGIEAVLPDGNVVSRLTGLVKDNSGYDLRSLFVGSEGTLGIITAVRLRLFPVLPHRSTALLALDDTAAAVAAVGVLRRSLTGLEAVELFYADGLDLVCAELGLPLPMPEAAPVYILVEGSGNQPMDDQLATVLAEIDGLRDAVVASSSATRDRLWEYREAQPLAVAAQGRPVKLDIAVPVGVLCDFERSLRILIEAEVPSAKSIIFGHLAEGNLHVNIMYVPPDDRDRLTETVLQHVSACGGSISAEHGVGVAKARWLPLSRSEQEVQTMRSIKSALDPNGLFNPGVLFPPEAKDSPRGRTCDKS